MASPIHEMPLTDFRDCVCNTLDSLPYDKRTLRAKVEMNLLFHSPTDGFTATADLIVFLSSMACLEVPEIPVIVECAFSQDRAKLWMKMKKEIDTHPEVALLVAIVITESPGYRSPEEDSEAWKKFVQEDTCRDAKTFLALKGHCATAEAQSLCIKVAGHLWCNVTSADYYVWVKDGDDQKIDIDCMHEAHGVSRRVTLSLSECRLILIHSDPLSLYRDGGRHRGDHPGVSESERCHCLVLPET